MPWPARSKTQMSSPHTGWQQRAIWAAWCLPFTTTSISPSSRSGFCCSAVKLWSRCSTTTKLAFPEPTSEYKEARESTLSSFSTVFQTSSVVSSREICAFGASSSKTRRPIFTAESKSRERKYWRTSARALPLRTKFSHRGSGWESELVEISTISPFESLVSISLTWPLIRHSRTWLPTSEWIW